MRSLKNIRLRTVSENDDVVFYTLKSEATAATIIIILQ